MKIRIYYEDTDCGGIVYHTNYIKYCERSRSEKFFFSLGLNPQEFSNAFVVKTIKADFIKSAKLGDEIEVCTQTLEVKNVSVLLKQEIYKTFEASSQTLCEDKIFDMEVRLAYINLSTGRPTPIPEMFLEILNAK